MAMKDMLIMNWQGKIPNEAVMMLQKDLESVDESKLNTLSMLKLKSNVVGLIFGIFLGAYGADRFYKGDIDLGIAKLFLGLISLIVTLINMFATPLGYVVFIVDVPITIWRIVDWFLVWKGIKKDNLQKIQNQIALLKN